jgi:hypothetical protein
MSRGKILHHVRSGDFLAVRVVPGVFRLRPTKRGTPALTSALIAAISLCLIAAGAVACVPPSKWCC